MRGLGLSELWVLGRTSVADIIDVPRRLFIPTPKGTFLAISSKIIIYER